VDEASVVLLDTKFFGANIRRLRFQRELSLARVAAAAGITPQTLSNYERGLTPSADSVRRVAIALGVRRQELLREPTRTQ
jgi:transcriptional regulator with XRE-family HTH domain